jgi:hypothetical protein
MISEINLQNILNFNTMKKQIFLLCLTAIFVTNCSGQQSIKNLINSNLKSRYSNFEIVSITQDSCPNLERLFGLSLSLKIVASECKLNISKATLSYYKKEINFDKTSELCKKEVDKIRVLAESWKETYFSKSEKCLLVKYRYSNSDGIKTTVEEYYSLNEIKYKEGNYPYLKKEFDAYYGFNFYKDVLKGYEEFLSEIMNS